MRTFAGIVALACACVMTHAAGVAPPAAPAEIPVILLLEGEPLADGDAVPLAAATTAPAAALRRETLRRQHAGVEARIHGLGGRVTDRFDTLLNALVVRLPASRLAAVRQLPGVRVVRRARNFHPLLSTSVPFIGAPAAWEMAGGGITGRGMRIGIIDSGVDYLHAHFGGSGDPDAYAANDSRRIEPGTFPTAKVTGGHDFVGDDFDADGTVGSTEPVEDPDPLDPAANGHGTHVAGIAAGFGVLTNGATFAGPYRKGLDPGAFLIGPGVAPEATVHAYKVFGRGGTTSFAIVVRALERCLDPNRDGQFDDRLDVVNLSLGIPFGIADASEPEVEAVNRLSRRGVVVVVAAGNNGNTHYVCASPAVAARAVTVANSIDNGATFTTVRVTAPAAAAGDYGAAEASFTPRLSTLPPVTAPVTATEPGLACADLANAAQLQGRIALIERGTCFFVDKVRRAQTAGAVGVVVINNVDGAPIEMGGQGDSSDIRIPALMISRLDGAILRGQLNAGLTMTLAAFAAVSRPELADQLNESSSRGPSTTDGRLKPDLAAPGTGITSAKPGTGTGFTSLTGTSMAAPHVAGAAALVRQARPDWTVEDIKAALMNTAVPTRTDRGVPYPESRSGIGRVQVDAAVTTTTVARSDSGEGDVGLSFGALVLSEPLDEIRNLRVVNHGDTPVTFRVGLADSAPVPGITLAPVVSSVTVGPGRSLLVPVQLRVNPSELRTRRDDSTPEFLGERPRMPLGEASGAMELVSDTQRLRVPWHVAVRSAAGFTATEPVVGVPDQPVATVPLPTRGGTAHPQPLVSVWESVFSGPRGDLDSGNLVAAGIATDFRSAADPTAARVFFGFATAGRWVTPQYEHLALEVEVDVDRDGDAEYIVFNSSAGNLSGQDFDASLSNDALMSLILDTSQTGTAFAAGGLLNVLAPTVRDTAPYHNRVAILSAPIQSLGLGPGKTRFRYRLTTTGLKELVQTESPWMDYDLAAPLVDATAFGIQGSPLFDEGRDVRVRIARDAARGAGRGSGNPLQVLLLHHHAQEVPAERITLALDDPDTDNDRLPDAWELEWFGDLEATAGGDQDRDGLVNAGELEAGTNPLEVRLLPPDPVSGSLRWTGVSGRYYTVERAAAVTGPFTTWKRRIPGRDPVTTLEEPVIASGAQPVFLRVLPE